MQTVGLHIVAQASPVLHAIAGVFGRQVRERCGLEVTDAATADVMVELHIEAGIGTEGYRIEDAGTDNTIRIVGNDERGVLYGIGKFLRASRYLPEHFEPGPWRGVSVPEKSVRGIYFATHFHNFYHDAPVDAVQRYVEDLALWGYNVVNVWFDMHHFDGIADPAAQAMIERLHAILSAANRIGIGASLAFLANEGYANSPVAMRADWTAGHDGYHHEPGGHYHVELCPNQPGAKALLLRWVDEKLSAFADVKLDYLWIWPYDQGGCTCGRCAPWGVNGFLDMAEPIARRYREAFPAGKVILSTWYFDHFTDGEWSGLSRVFARRPDWVDYLMVDDYGDHFPEYPLRHGVPGGLPMVNFPEISMYACDPWGGYGANPMPRHLQQLWNSAGQHLAGGFPYSEGIYEDINKAVCAQYYWQPQQSALDTVREYISYEYSPDVGEAVIRATEILERNLPHARQRENGKMRLVMPHTDQAVEAFALLRGVDAQLTPQARSAWRWRILYLRALIDAELADNGCAVTEACEDALQELATIYHAENAHDWVAPPTRRMLAA
ncbi:MAG: glycoside hydrolase family 20 zincin-like fold domain-containing protein [Chloroflexi bacterium]|nr:glycoside hydrolase family 20 zincin-like fold domain-containing protein [Chloroflexota bacterium]